MSIENDCTLLSWKTLYLHNARLGLAPLLGGILYARYLEYPIALRLAGQLDGKRILDIGSGRRARFPLLLLSRMRQGEVHATDVVNYVEYHNRLARRFRGAARESVKFISAEQDAVALDYPDSYFDLIFAISTIEHIPEGGDTRAMREVSRVIRPGGRAVISVPYTSARYREEFRWQDSASLSHSEPVFFERTYDSHALDQRLISASGLQLVSSEYIGEPGFQFWSRFYSKLLPLPYYFQWLTMPFRILMPLFSSAYLRVVNKGTDGVMSIVFSVRRPD